MAVEVERHRLAAIYSYASFRKVAEQLDGLSVLCCGESLPKREVFRRADGGGGGNGTEGKVVQKEPKRMCVDVLNGNALGSCGECFLILLPTSR